MKATVHHVAYGEIEYEESVWTGRRDLSFSGKPLERKKRNLFLYRDGTRDVECRIRGNFLYGTTLIVEGEEIVLTPSCKWYEIALPTLLFAFLLVWGNVPALGAIVPIVGGALGGAVAGGAWYATLYLMRRVKDPGLKLLVWLGMLAGSFLVCFLLALMILLIFF